MVEKSHIIELVASECARERVDPNLILALIQTESGFNPNAARYERHFMYYHKLEDFAKIQRITLETEKVFQKTSWGLMQIMGGTARWCGYAGFLPDLCDPLIGVIWGVAYFKKMCAKQVYLNDQIAIYNSGSVRKNSDGTYINQEYVDKVLGALSEYQKNSGRVFALTSEPHSVS